MTLMTQYPRLTDLAAPARRRAARIGWEYLDSGTGEDTAEARNRAAMEAITLRPRFFDAPGAVSLETATLGRTLPAPFAVAPIGMQSLMWPGAEKMIAAACQARGVPYGLSTVAGESIETIAAITGPLTWFQLYAPHDDAIRNDLIDRAIAAGVEVMHVTIDVPFPSRRERQRKAGVQMPPKLTPAFLWDLVTHPQWSLATARRGPPRMETFERYATAAEKDDMIAFIMKHLNAKTDLALIEKVRARWPGKLLVKGVLGVQDARDAMAAGADGVVVSNHGGRQLDPVVPAIDALPAIRDALPDAHLSFDSGIRSGADVARALALGADLAHVGRPMVWAAMALGARGPAHALDILFEETLNVMHQLGCRSPAEVRGRV